MPSNSPPLANAPNPASITEAEAEKITSLVMRRQLALSLRVASVFFVLLFGLPLVNLYAPALANTSILGFTLTWLTLGVLVYPITVALSYYFVRNSDAIEADCVQITQAARSETHEAQP